jgi:hypothetical protein
MVAVIELIIILVGYSNEFSKRVFTLNTRSCMAKRILFAYVYKVTRRRRRLSLISFLLGFCPSAKLLTQRPVVVWVLP